MKHIDIVPVVFAANDNYAPYLGVALYSLITNSNPKQRYHIYLLFTDISLEHQRRLKQMEQDNISIFCMDIKEHIENIHDFKGVNHLSVETICRLYISELLPQYDKILYLDSDILVLDDVYHLYQQDIKDHIFLVAENALCPFVIDYFNTHLNVHPNKSFNAGILVINTKKFLSEEIKEKCLALLIEDWANETQQFWFQDQDVLNIVCHNKVAFFPMNWNLEWVHNLQGAKDDIYLLIPESKKIFDEAKKDISVLHYGSATKPWSFPEEPLAELFWNYAKKTNFYEEILLKETQKNPQKPIPFLRLFPWDLVQPASTIVIYGAGVVGQGYLKQVSAASYCTVAAIFDRNALNIKDFPSYLIGLERLSSVEYDKILIAIEKEGVANAIRQDLVALGVPSKKIIWI